MNEYKKSNYAINKVRKGIVYRNADGSILEVTFEKIAKDNPNFTVEDFEKLKRLSDELYHEEEKSDNLQAHYVKSSLNAYTTEKLPTSVSAEEHLILKENENSFVNKLLQAIDTQLTPIQKKRLYMHCFKKMTTREIAEIEGKAYSSVTESIREAKLKLKALFPGKMGM